MDQQLESGQTEVLKNPTYQELVKLVAELRAELNEMKAIIQAQAEKIRQLELENRLLKEENKFLKKKLYGSRSERKLGKNKEKPSGSSTPGKAKNRVRPLSAQYPNAEVEHEYEEFKKPPLCQCCDAGMVDSGLEEVTEQVHTIPAKHKIIMKHRRKYKCTRCFMGLVTAPLPARIAPGSSLGDSFIIEAAIAKFYSLIPAERYALMVSQSGFTDFSPRLVLAAHHALAEFLKPLYLYFQNRIRQGQLLFADETPHRMLEQDGGKQWFLWAFSANGSTYFEIHDTRSGDVAIDFLIKSDCLYLMSDVFSGYVRAIRKVNEIRRMLGLPEITALFCNAHSRRKFVEAAISFPEEAQFFIDQYEMIYKLEKELKILQDPRSRLEKRAEMKPFFEAMLETGKRMVDHYPDKSSIITAFNYLNSNYAGLTRFIENPDLPIDNNLSERQLRSPVIGRKTWLGTHSKRGAETTEILFTVMQSCKYLKVDPRKYLNELTESMLRGQPPFTPSEYLDNLPDKKVA